jgi:hypothetical protein
MDMVNNLEASAIVGEEMSDLRMSRTVESRLAYLEPGRGALRKYRFPLIELTENAGPRLAPVGRISVQCAHGLVPPLDQNGQFNCYLVRSFELCCDCDLMPQL